MNESTQRILLEGLKGAFKTSTLVASGSIVTGAAVTTVTVPNTILWGLITVGATTTTTIVAPVVASFAIAGAVIGGLSAALNAHRKMVENQRRFQAYLN